MPRFRKLPVEIDAVLWDGANEQEIKDFTNAVSVYFTRTEGLYIETLEGTMHATAGDYIIRGVQGELYPCKPDIFLATYEEV